MKPDVSVIVPIYNVAGYLEQCLDSLVNQSHKNIEIICIDDGSTDKSGEIIDAYAAKDKRVKAIHQPNAGVSAARNKGLETARGEYISFVDGDDWVDTNAYQTILAEIGDNRPDMVLFRNATVFEKDIRLPRPLVKDERFGNDFNFELLIRKYSGTVWGKLFRRQFIRQHALRFISGVSIGEDGLFNMACFAAEPTVYQFEDCFYFYRLFRKGSTTEMKFSLDICEKQRQACENAPFYATLPPERKMIVDAEISVYYTGRFMTLNNDEKQQNLPYLENLHKLYEKRYGQETMLKNDLFARLDTLVKNGGKLPVKPQKQLFYIGNSRDKRYKILRLFGAEFRLWRRKSDIPME